MRTTLRYISFGLALVASLMPLSVRAQDNIMRQMLIREALPNAPGYTLTSVTVDLAPGHLASAHTHEAFVYVYVLEGDVRSQLGNAKPVEYTAGGSWTEHPGSVHTLTQNLSKTDHAKLLAIFIGKDDAKLTTSGTIGR